MSRSRLENGGVRYTFETLPLEFKLFVAMVILSWIVQIGAILDYRVAENELENHPQGQIVLQLRQLAYTLGQMNSCLRSPGCSEETFEGHFYDANAQIQVIQDQGGEIELLDPNVFDLLHDDTERLVREQADIVLQEIAPGIAHREDLDVKAVALSWVVMLLSIVGSVFSLGQDIKKKTVQSSIN